MAASKWLTLSVALAVAAFSASTAFSVYVWRRKTRCAVNEKVEELEELLKAALENCAAERQGRIRAQQALRKALANPNSDNIGFQAYPMAPIAIIQSCFSTRNGTPRQPLLVPLARASLMFNPARVPQASLEGLEGYSHCWIIYVFHLNTDLEKLWKHPSRSKFKAKVRVPRLKGERMGIFSTRSPHRPCPIGLTVAKVEAVQGNKLLLSGVDLVDGTPVLDVKPYLPYCDSIQGAMVPDWVKMDDLIAISSVNFSSGFTASLSRCWSTLEKRSLYASPEEFQSLIKQVLSWDIRSVSQRSRPHTSSEFGISPDDTLETNEDQDNEISATASKSQLFSSGVIYHLILEGLDVSYRIDCNGTVLVEDICLSSHAQESNKLTTAIT